MKDYTKKIVEKARAKGIKEGSQENMRLVRFKKNS